MTAEPPPSPTEEPGYLNALLRDSPDGEDRYEVVPADLEAIIAGTIEPTLADRLERDDGQPLAYSGRVNCAQGEPESGKTWLTNIDMARTIAAGLDVALIDFEDTPRAAIERLRALGCTDAQLVERLRYFGPDQLDGRTAELVVAGAVATQPALVVVDSFAPMLAAYGLDESKAEDIYRARRVWLDPFTAIGSTVWMIDHVVKSKEERGRWGRGSGAKLAMFDGAVYSVSTTGFNRTTPGRIRLTLQKDRHGSLPGVRGDALASIYMQPRPDGTLRAAIDTPLDTSTPTAAADIDDDAEVRAAISEQVPAILRADGQLSTTRIKDALRADLRPKLGDRFGRLKFRNDLAAEVLEELAARGEIVAEPGKHGGRRWSTPPEQLTIGDAS